MALGKSPAVTVAVHSNGTLPPAESVRGVIVTGSPAMVTDDLPWIAHTRAWLADAVAQSIPTLGICFGHQLLAQALGGRVDYNPAGIEVGTINLTLADGVGFDPLLHGLPREIQVQASHRQSVLQLPPDALRLASSALDPNHAFRFRKHAWGLQFHPEFSSEISRIYIEYYRNQLDNRHKSPEALISELADTPVGGQILKRFFAVIDATVRPT